MDKIYAALEQSREQHLERLLDVLKQPTIFNDHKNIRKCAEKYMQYLKQAGFHDVTLMETDGSPLVFAEYNCGAPKTVLVYNFFDMLPSTNEDYVFDSEVRNIEPFGKCLTGRGIGTKVSGIAFINAIESCLKVDGKLPVNLKFLAEGEEMYGSIHIPWLIENHPDKLEDVDAIFVPSMRQNNEGKVTSIQLGGKGFVGYELVCSGERWGRGPQKHDSHSSTKAMVDSPMWRLVEAINTFVGDSGKEILIDGFFDEVRPITTEEQEYLDLLAESFDGESVKRRLSVETFYKDAKGKQVLKQNLFDPTLNIEGIPYSSVDPVGVVSHKAVAKFQSRLVPNQTAEGMISKVRHHLDARGYEDIDIKKLYGFGPARTDINEPIVQAVLKVYKDEGMPSPIVYPSSPASSPVNAFNNSLGIPCISGGLGHVGRKGEKRFLIIDEQDKIAGLVKLERTLIKILENYADLAGT
jgi:acetylornithine deacetylase/succinyl-diaminopimelate desuccinylase-like protein